MSLGSFCPSTCICDRCYMCTEGCVTKTPPTGSHGEQVSGKSTEVQERGPQGTGEPEEDTVWLGWADRAVGSEEEKGATECYVMTPSLSPSGPWCLMCSC